MASRYAAAIAACRHFAATLSRRQRHYCCRRCRRYCRCAFSPPLPLAFPFFADVLRHASAALMPFFIIFSPRYAADFSPLFIIVFAAIIIIFEHFAQLSPVSFHYCAAIIFA
jgi:hypothetical protein